MTLTSTAIGNHLLLMQVEQSRPNSRSTSLKLVQLRERLQDTHAHPAHPNDTNLPQTQAALRDYLHCHAVAVYAYVLVLVELQQQLLSLHRKRVLLDVIVI